MLSMKNVIDDKNPLIREKSKEVSLPLSDEDRHTLMEMYQYLVDSQDEEKAEKYDLRPGVGIAAIQIGIPKRMCAIYIPSVDEEGISSKEFMEHYRAFTSIADSKALQKQLDKAFEEASGYSIYKVFKRSQEEEWVKL